TRLFRDTYLSTYRYTRHISHGMEQVKNHHMNVSNHPPDSILFILRGIGDLYQRKLTQALYNLFLDQWMPVRFVIVGIGRSQYNDDTFRQHLQDGVNQFSRRKSENDGKWAKFAEHVSYLQMNGDNSEDYHKISDFVERISQQW